MATITDKDFNVNEARVDTTPNTVNEAPPVADEIPPETTGDQVDDDGLNQVYNDLAKAREKEDIHALEKALNIIYSSKSPEDGFIVPQFIQSKPKVSIPAGSFGTNASHSGTTHQFGVSAFGVTVEAASTKTPVFGGFKNVRVDTPARPQSLPPPKINESTPPPPPQSIDKTNNIQSEKPPSTQHSSPATSDPTKTHEPAPVAKPKTLSRSDIPKFQFVISEVKHAPNEKVFESATDYFRAVEKIALLYKRAIDDVWKVLVQYSFRSDDLNWVKNTLFKVKTWSEAKKVIFEHPLSLECTMFYVRQIVEAVMAEDETVAVYYERFARCLRHAGLADDCVFASRFFHGLTPSIKQSVGEVFDEDEFILASHVAEIARKKELEAHQKLQAKKRPLPSSAAAAAMERPTKAAKQTTGPPYFCTKHLQNFTHDTEDCIPLNKIKREKAGRSNPLATKTPILINGIKMIARCSPGLEGESYITLHTVKKHDIAVNQLVSDERRFGLRVLGKTGPVSVNYLNGISFTQVFDILDTGRSDSDLVLGPEALVKMGLRLQGVLVKDDDTCYNRSDLVNLNLSLFKAPAKRNDS